MPKSIANPEPARREEVAPDSEEAVIPCSLEEVENHLRSFIAAFIQPNVQARWLEFLIDKRAEWDKPSRSPREGKLLHKADALLRMFAADRRYCVRVPNAQGTKAFYEATFGKSPGIYFSLRTLPCKLTAMEADTKFHWEDESALLSFQAGKKALFFCHDGGVYLCEKE